MELSHELIGRLLEPWIDSGWDYASEYGEPGYSFPHGATTPMFIKGYYWCHCDKFGQDRHGNKLHSIMDHHPRVFKQMEDQGVEFHWDDEWVIDYDNDKAYRCQPDSYSWQQSFRWTEDGDMLTPDDDIEMWIEESVNNPHKCFPSHVFGDADLEAKGFKEYQCGFENGWYGQEDNPEEISKLITEEYAEQDKEVDILYKLSYVAQFDLGFCVFVREIDRDDEEAE